MIRPFTMMGVPIDSVARSGGTERSPEALRKLGLAEVLGIDVGDALVGIRGDERDPTTGILASEGVLSTTRTLRQVVADVVVGGERPFLVGGCCSELPGALAGARDAIGRVGLAYLDGHLDLYDGEKSPTGEAADMPMSVVLGRGPGAWVEACGGASVRVQDAAVLGYRDLDESQEAGMVHPDHLGPLFTHLDAEAVRAQGPGAVGERVAGRLEDDTVGYWVHLDVDVLDQDVFPATDYLMPGGLEWDELVSVLRPLMRSPAVLGASVACYNPEKDPGDRCGIALVDAWATALSD